MDLRPGFAVGLGGEKVCKLKKAVYGLSNLLELGLGDFTQSMEKFGKSNSDHTLFLKHKEGKVIALIETGSFY